jgi:hypothetical protein
MPSPVARHFERTELPPALQPQLRLYRRLYLSRIDLEEAKAIAEDLLARRIALPRSKLPSALLLAMNTALVVSYARPFVQSRGQSEVAEKAVPGILLRSLTAREREMHEALITMRNKEVAHSDAEILEMSFEVFEGGDGAIFKHAREPFRRPVLRAILKLVAKLEYAMHQRCEELTKELPNNVWL